MKIEDYEKYITKKAFEIGLILNKDITHADIFSDAYLEHHEKNKNIFLCIVNQIYTQKHIINGQKQRGKKVDASYEKKCNKCSITKNQSEFRHMFSKRYNIFYLDSYCCECRKEYNRKRYKHNYENNLECKNKYKENSRLYSKKNKDFKRWRYNNDAEYREKIIAKNKRYRDKKRQNENNKATTTNNQQTSHS